MRIRLLTAVLGASVVLGGLVGSAEAKNGPKEIYSIVDLALDVNAESGEFSTLIAAVVATGLDGVLDGKGQFTVFAPTDAAFDAIDLDAEAIGELNDEELSGLADILLYHVARGRRLSTDVVESDQIRTVSKGFLGVTVSDEGVFVNGSEILIEAGLFDLEVDNGVVHVIDAVLLP